MRQIKTKIVVAGILCMQMLALSAMRGELGHALLNQIKAEHYSRHDRILYVFPNSTIEEKTDATLRSYALGFLRSMEAGTFTMQCENLTPHEIILYQKNQLNEDKQIAEIAAGKAAFVQISRPLESISSDTFSALIKAEEPIKIPVETNFTKPAALIKTFCNILRDNEGQELATQVEDLKELLTRVVVELPKL